MKKTAPLGVTGRRRPLWLAGLMSIAIVIAGLVVPATAAVAAGPGVLSVSLTPVHYLTGETLTQTEYGQNGDKVAYRVAYSCAIAECTDTVVALSPSQPNPYGLDGVGLIPTTLLTYETWTRPTEAPDVTPGGTDATGKTFSLGTLASGASGTFVVTYAVPPTGTYTTPRGSQFYPDGFEIEMSGTISSPNAVAPVTMDAAPVTWHNQVPEPGVRVTTSAASVRPDTTVTVMNQMGSGSFPRVGSGSISGTSQWVAAGSYVVVEHLPEQAVVVGAIPDGGVYDPDAHTITWTRGSLDSPDFDAAGGWGSETSGNWSARNGYGPRNVQLSFPVGNFPDADANGCNFEASLPITLETSVTYLDDARTTKTASTESTITVACWDPFGESDFSKTSTANASSGGERLLNVPDAGAGPNSFYWRVIARNGGNVPGVAVIEDDLDHADAPVQRIAVNSAAVVEWNRSDGVSGTSTGSVTAPAGTHFTWARVTSPEIAPTRTRPTETGTWTNFTVDYHYTVASDAPIGERRTNTASSTMSWPSQPQLTPQTASESSTIRFRKVPTARPVINARFPVAPVVEGGGLAVPGRNVTFTVDGTTTNVPDGTVFTPEYVFIAPAGWEITPESAQVPDAPEGAQFEYSTRTVAGVERQVVVATWPEGTVFGTGGALPVMTVVAAPTYAVAAGTQSQATAWIGDSARNWDNTEATYGGAVQNSEDVDGSGELDAWFASANRNIAVSSTDNLAVTKEICQPDPDADDGCLWISDSTQSVQVPTESDITYRVVLQNLGNTALSDVVAYDVLPHIGDTGLIPSTQTTPRGSTFQELLKQIDQKTDNLSLAFSSSTDPARPEVNPSAGGVDDWGTTTTDAAAIRAKVTGSLAPGEKAGFTYTARVMPGSDVDAIACNSVAIVSNRTLASEPSPVCAETAEADLRVGVVDEISAQLGRPASFPFVIENLGGSQLAEGTVLVEIPEGVTLTSISSAGWTCDHEAAPVEGPAAFECVPDGPFAKGEPRDLVLETVVTASSVAVTATVNGSTFDPDPDNNTHTIRADVAEAATVLPVVKDDGVSGVVPGQVVTYDVTVTNPLRLRALNDVKVVDTLPQGAEFVSADAGGSPVPGGVEWTIPTIAANSSTMVSVTVWIADDQPLDRAVVNVVEVEAIDPDHPDDLLVGSARDSDTVDGIRLEKTGSLRAPADAADPRVGDVIEYRFVIQNIGGGELAGVDLSDELDGLSAITYPDGWPSQEGVLGSGEQVVGVATYSLTAADIDAGEVTNIAEVTAASSGGEDVTSTSTDVRDLPQSPGLLFEKDAVLDVTSTVEAGDEVTFTFRMENTGNVTLRDVEVTDALEGLEEIRYSWPGVDRTLGAGDIATASARYVLTQEDIDRGTVVNVATVSGVGPDDELVEQEDSESVVIPAVPAISLEKSGELLGEQDHPVPGQVIEYSFVVQNTGNVSVTGIDIDDQLEGVSDVVFLDWPGDAGVLAPGQSVTAEASYVLSQADIDAGQVRNVATATADGARGGEVTAEAGADISISQVSSLRIAKEALLKDANKDGDANPGETIEYAFVVENSGNTTLVDVRVEDPMVTGVPVLDELAPGESVRLTADAHTVTREDAHDGRVTNTASAIGTDPNGDTVTSDPDTARTPFSIPAGGGDGLAMTGGQVAGLLIVFGAVMIAGGLLLTLIMRSRRSRRASGSNDDQLVS